MAGVLLDAHWRRLAALLGRPELGQDPRYASALARIERRAEVDALVGAWAAERDVAGAVAELGAASIPAAPVRSYAEAAADPHVRARDMLQEVERPDGARIPLTGPAAKLSRTPGRVRRPAPALGADSEAILRELGLSDDERRALFAAGVVFAPATAQRAD